MKFISRHFDVYFPDAALDLGDIPPATAFLSITYVVWTVVLSLLRTRYMKESLSGDMDPRLVVVPFIQMVPNQVLFNPTSLVFSNLVDTESWKFVFNFFNLLIGGSFIERFWQSPGELLKFVLVLGTLTNLIVVLITIVLSIILPAVRLDLPLDGNYTVLVGFPIIYKQLFPETTLFETKNLPFISKNFRFKLLPIFTLVLISFIQLLWFHHFSQLLSIWITFFTCYLYLRFFQKLPASMAEDAEFEVVGDASETFQLIYFFPDLVKPLLEPIFDISYKKFIIDWQVATPFRTYDIEQANMMAQKRGAKPVDVIDPEERRKQLALQVLEERLLDNKNEGNSIPQTNV
ncbi:unnamed protein product [Kluyveromyces dobzhanskii CBS 2104]|uniref:WGS project CCBQ000000000 data, contig 00015 n=1 Tax=Kluyveromyces dobzhanskii CBS 2104 TaxID=1427455 RepID=A0A0A8LAW1_9SACH|nr:unnamed protein product [Kluyveromyces dobzhanskii CBS 2104]